jgi:hypothetical protein
MSQSDSLRAQLASMLDGHDAHVTFDKAVADLAPALRGRRPDGLPYSPWRLVEHLRISQRDILDFCRNPKYVEQHWPDDYWPKTDAPASERAWDASLADFRSDLELMKQLALDPAVDLFAKIPHGSGQTYLREIILVAEHNSYHVGQLVVVRRQLGAWGKS